jgi:hypothetical protein
MQGLLPLLVLMAFHATVLIFMNSRYALSRYCLYDNVQVSELHFVEVLVMNGCVYFSANWMRKLQCCV